MKIFISADIEGVSGITFSEESHWETEEYKKCADQMTREVLMAIEGATEAGATEIVVKDGHGKGSNIDFLKMPENVKLIRGKSGHPYNMMYGLDESFDGVIYIGYHSRAGSDQNTMSHTNTGNSFFIKLNDEYASEFMINSYIAASLGVPILFLTGDEGICNDAKKLVPGIKTLATKKCVGGSAENLSPKFVEKSTKELAKKAVEEIKNAKALKVPEKFTEEIKFKSHINAYKMSFYPGAEKIDSHTIKIEAGNIMEIVTANMFVLY